MTIGRLAGVLGLLAGVAIAAGCATMPTKAETSARGVSSVTPQGDVIADVPADAAAGDAVSVIERVADGSGGLTKLPPDYLHHRLLHRAATPAIEDAFERLRMVWTPAAHADLIRAIELDFVHAVETSSLDLLNPELAAHFRGFAWQAEDYPGGPEGPNEAWSRLLADALDQVTPERRANRARHAVIVREEATEALWDYMLAQWSPVPGEGDWKLNRHAVEAYVRMRAAAAADGVELRVLSGHRDPQRAAENAARVGNSYAVASFSSHSLGLAIDFRLPRPGGKVVEGADAAEGTGAAFPLTTRPMAEVVDMRRSPVHKWLHLYGDRFGWYPFQHEPWHWEFNPPGFRPVFFAEFPGGPPPRPR